jgi:hypothetical protein
MSPSQQTPQTPPRHNSDDIGTPDRIGISVDPSITNAPPRNRRPRNTDGRIAINPRILFPQTHFNEERNAQ